ncbi:MAG: hypothetical protein C4342_04425 [Armatimonadota bacterium]
MEQTPGLNDLLIQTLQSRDLPRLLYAVSDRAREGTGARNAMVALFNEELGYMTLRAGSGSDWQPEMIGERISIGQEEHEGITAWVAARGMSYRSDDVTKEARYRVLIPSTRSELASPIFDRYGRVRGALNVESDEVGNFSDTDQEYLELLAAITAIALDRQDARDREQAMREVSTALDLAQTEEELLQRVAMVIERVMHVSAYSIFLWSDIKQAYVLRDVVGSSALPPDASYRKGEGCTGCASTASQSVLRRRSTTHAGLASTSSFRSNRRPRSWWLRSLAQGARSAASEQFAVRPRTRLSKTRLLRTTSSCFA